MNSKTLELLEKFVGEEDNEELDNLDEKINIFEEKINDNKQFNNDLLENNDDINKLFEKINSLESKENNEKKDNDDMDGIDHNNSNKENDEQEDINPNVINKEELLLKIILKKEYNSKLIYFKHWKNLSLITL